MEEKGKRRERRGIQGQKERNQKGKVKKWDVESEYGRNACVTREKGHMEMRNRRREKIKEEGNIEKKV